MNQRTLIFSVLVVSILLVFKFCGNKPDQENFPEHKPVPLSISQNSEPFNESFSTLLQSYYSLKDAFIKVDTSKVNSAAIQLMQNADSLNVNEVKGDTSGMIRETAKYFASTISSSANAVTGDNDINGKRREFNMITDALWSLTRTVKYDGQKVYYHFCPDAFDNTGGYWLSDTIDTGNPYMGDNEKGCSQVNDSLDYSER